MSPGLAALTLVVVFVVGWFAVGTHYNVRKGDAAMRWLQDGLPLIGEKTTVRWLGSSVLELKIQQAKPPFQHAQILIVLEPRDVAPLWAFAHWRGRRDLFIFRAVLRTVPRLELEVLDPNSWRGHGNVQPTKAWMPLPAYTPLVTYPVANASAAVEFLKAISIDGSPLQLLALHHAEPHLEVQWRFDPLHQQPARTVFEAVHRIARLL